MMSGCEEERNAALLSSDAVSSFTFLFASIQFAKQNSGPFIIFCSVYLDNHDGDASGCMKHSSLSLITVFMVFFHAKTKVI